MAINGLQIVTPTSVVKSGGGSVSINANGSVNFATVTDFRLQGIFSSTYDDYLMLFNAKPISTTQSSLTSYMMNGGTSETTAVYGSTYREFGASTIGVTDIYAILGSYASQCKMLDGSFFGQDGVTFECYISNPYVNTDRTLYQGTAVSTTAGSLGAADSSGFIQTNTSYDGLRLTSSATITGTVAIYGFTK